MFACLKDITNNKHIKGKKRLRVECILAFRVARRSVKYFFNFGKDKKKSKMYSASAGSDLFKKK